LHGAALAAAEQVAVLPGTVAGGREPLRARSRAGAGVHEIERSGADAAGLRSARQAAVAYPPCRARPDLRAPYRGYGVCGSCESSDFARAYVTRPAARCPTPTCMRASASHAPASSGSRRVASRAYATACTASWWYRANTAFATSALVSGWRSCELFASSTVAALGLPAITLPKASSSRCCDL